MSPSLLTILLIAGILGINASKNSKTLLDIEKILNSLIKSDTAESKELEYSHKVNYHKPSHHTHEYTPHGNKHHNMQSPNLMNVQTMNLFMKPNHQRYNLDNTLRTENDRICQKTGRCGCTGTRCGDMTNREDDEVDNIVDELNKKIERKEIKTKGKDSDDSDEFDKTLRCEGDRCEYERYSPDYYGRPDNNHINDIDIILLDSPQLNTMDENDFIDLTRNSLLLDDDATNKESALILEPYNKAKAMNLDRYESPPTPDEFVNHYRTVKNDVIVQLKYYIQNNTPIPLKHLHDTQKKLLKSLKIKYNQGLVRESELKSEIVHIVFGEKSGTKIYPHVENNDNIYVPKWHYNSLLQFKRDLRSQKRILPLTTQQRERLLKKQTKTIPKLVWRKSLNQNKQKFGVPFNLVVHGLGQINT